MEQESFPEVGVSLAFKWTVGGAGDATRPGVASRLVLPPWKGVAKQKRRLLAAGSWGNPLQGI
jgi:hypothetical protein